MRQIILDTETTGIDPRKGHRIIEIGCVEMIDRRLTGETFHHYINPERAIDPGAMRVHGIRNEFLLDKPTFIKVVDELMEFIKGAELVIHNAPFDLGFLNYELMIVKPSYGKIEDHCSIVDTLVLAREKHRGQKNNLDALTRRYDIKNFNRKLHGALLDSEILAQVYLAMTGGQNALFAETGSDGGDHPTLSAVTASKNSSERKQATPILSPTDEEQNAHLAYLKKLKEKNEQLTEW